MTRFASLPLRAGLRLELAREGGEEMRSSFEMLVKILMTAFAGFSADILAGIARPLVLLRRIRTRFVLFGVGRIVVCVCEANHQDGDERDRKIDSKERSPILHGTPLFFN